MREVFNKMGKQKVEWLTPFDIFLPAVGAEAFFHLVSAVQAGLIFSDFPWLMGKTFGANIIISVYKIMISLRFCGNL